jgi:Tol biopolymer transport system component
MVGVPIRPPARLTRAENIDRGGAIKKIALAGFAASLVVVTIVATRAVLIDSGSAQSAGTVPGTPTGSATQVALPDSEVPAVDYTFDLETGLMTPLPETIIASLGPTYVGTSTYDRGTSRYAVLPEGSKLAYIADDPVDQTTVQLFVADIDGTGIRQLTRHPPVCCPASPDWSPDGTKVVFQAPQGIYIVDVASGSLTQVVPADPNYVADKEPTFSPDGTRIIYTHDGVRAVPVSGGPSTLLFGGGIGGMSGASNASVSPDGTQVTMFGHIGESCCYRVLGNIDGTELQPLGNVAGWDMSLGRSNVSGTWSPNANRIVTVVEIDGIGVTDVATGQVEIVARGNGAIWLDDHTLLVEVS